MDYTLKCAYCYDEHNGEDLFFSVYLDDLVCLDCCVYLEGSHQ